MTSVPFASLPRPLEQASNQLLQQIRALKKAKFKRIIAIVSNRPGLGENIVLNAVLSEIETSFIAVRFTEPNLDHYDVESLSNEFHDSIVDHVEKKVIDEAYQKKSLKDRVDFIGNWLQDHMARSLLFVLPFYKTHPRFWTPWRVFIEDSIANLLILTSRTGWERALSDAPEIAGCSSEISLEKFFTSKDFDRLDHFISGYLVRESLTNDEMEEVKSFMSSKIEDINLQMIQRKMFDILLRREETK